jgi:hypothetical protein
MIAPDTVPTPRPTRPISRMTPASSSSHPESESWQKAEHSRGEASQGSDPCSPGKSLSEITALNPQRIDRCRRNSNGGAFSSEH